MKILIAEDSADKIARLRSFLSSEHSLSDDDITIVQSVYDAQQALRGTAYDLFILDVLLPNRAGDEPGHAGTVGLLEELATRATLRKPRHVLGLTAFDEAIREAGPAFVERTWAVIKFSYQNDGWKGQISACVRYIADESNQRRNLEYGTDLCIVTALSAPELSAVTRLNWSWRPAEPLDDSTFVHRGSFNCGSEVYSVVAAAAPKTGMVHSALMAAKLIERDRPRFLVMTGICAGVRGKTNYGDVILGDPVWDWQSGKHSVTPGGPEFGIAPDPIPASNFIRSRFDQLRLDAALWTEIKGRFPSTPETELKARPGPMASGSSVLADDDVLDKIKLQNRNLLAVEMEAFGVLAAATETCMPRPTGLAIKSVCDFGNAEKDDTWQAYAAYTSAEATRAFFERYMTELRALAGTR